VFKSRLNSVQKLLCPNDTIPRFGVDVSTDMSDELCSLKGA